LDKKALDMVKEITEKFPQLQSIDGERVKIKPTEEELAKLRQSYRQEYRNRPLVKAKREERAKDPNNIKKRQEYSKDPQVKERKKYQGKIKRQMGKKLKEEYPEIYNKIQSTIKASSQPLEVPSAQNKPWVRKGGWISKEDLKKKQHSSTTTSESSEDSSSEF
jgi:hypothetical protein